MKKLYILILWKNIMYENISLIILLKYHCVGEIENIRKSSRHLSFLHYFGTNLKCIERTSIFRDQKKHLMLVHDF